MSIEHFKTEILTWANALSANDSGDFKGALRLFEPISGTSKILLNMALIHDRLGERAEGIKYFTRAIELDNYLAIGYFQRGVAYFHGEHYAEAVQDFTTAQTKLRTNLEINYNALGLDYRLKLEEILFNKWLALLRLGKTTENVAVLQAITDASPPPALKVMVDKALKDPQACSPCCLPEGILYRPSASIMEFIRKAEETGEVHAASSPGAPFMAPSLRSASSDASSTFLPSVSSRKGHRKQKSSTGSTDKGSPLARDMGSVTHVPKRAELNRVIGADMEKPLTEIDGIPCAGVRITHGTMSGLMAWRFVVRLDASAPRTKRLSSMRPAVVVNFILDTGSESSYVPPAALTALNYLGDTNPGAEVTLLVQGVKTKCKVAHPDEAGRVGLSFMTAGSLTYYFDASLVAPVLYDGSGERPARVPRTIRAEDLPRGSWVALVKAKILAIFGLSH